MHIQIRGTQISVSFWFAAVLCILTVTDKSGAASCAFLSALAHEFGHILVFSLQKRAPAQLTFTPFGLKLVEPCCAGSASYAKEIQAAFAGPLVNLILCCFALHSQLLFSVNAALFVFNMLPVREMDGGRILYAFIAMKTNPLLAEKVLTYFGLTCVVITFVLFVLGAYVGKYNFSLFLAFFYLGTLTLTSEPSGLLNRKSN